MSLDSCSLPNTVVGSLNSCTGELEYASYNYNVTKWTAVLFVVLFALSSIAHLVQGIRSRYWFMLWTVLLCAVGELIGWGGRSWSAESIEWSPNFGGYWASNDTAFLMQIASLIISPAFLTAGWYVMLGRVIQYLGPQFCSLTNRTYLIVFVGGDVASLVIQAVGGGSAASAETNEAAEDGARIMVAGVIVQMVIMILYSFVFLEFVFRYLKNIPVNRQIGFRRAKNNHGVPYVAKGSRPRSDVRKCEILLAAMVLSTILVFVRSVYRTVELLDGWNGPIISNETLFCVLDAMTVFLATAVFNLVHPGQFLPHATETESAQEHGSPDTMTLESKHRDRNGTSSGERLV